MFVFVFLGRGAVCLFRRSSVAPHSKFKVRKTGPRSARADLPVADQKTEDPLPPPPLRSVHHPGQQRLRVALPHAVSAGRGGWRLLHQSGARLPVGPGGDLTAQELPARPVGPQGQGHLETRGDGGDCDDDAAEINRTRGLTDPCPP
ncbi:hypothetical protein CRUP_008931, partial [Coryphaenoides rupestris]